MTAVRHLIQGHPRSYRKPTCNFLLVINSIFQILDVSHTVFKILTNKAREQPVFPPHPTLVWRPRSGDPVWISYPTKTRGVGLLYGENCTILTSTVYERAIAYSALSMLSRAKNGNGGRGHYSYAFGRTSGPRRLDWSKGRPWLGTVLYSSNEPGELPQIHALMTRQKMLLCTTICQPQCGGRGGRMGSEMGPLSSPCMTSYRLPIVTIGLSLTVFAMLRMFQTARQTDGRTELVSQ